MRGDFVLKFLEELKGTAIDLSNTLSRVPYKGFRYDRFGTHNQKRYKGFKNLKRRGLIRDIDNNSFNFTKSGQKWLSRSFDRYFRLTNDKWDKKWRVVIFDIPQELHKERVKFRRKLKSLGFVMLQKSVFVFPYSCHEEVADICINLRISDYVNLIIAESIGFPEKELLELFNLP